MLKRIPEILFFKMTLDFHFIYLTVKKLQTDSKNIFRFLFVYIYGINIIFICFHIIDTHPEYLMLDSRIHLLLLIFF